MVCQVELTRARHPEKGAVATVHRTRLYAIFPWVYVYTEREILTLLYDSRIRSQSEICYATIK